MKTMIIGGVSGAVGVSILMLLGYKLDWNMFNVFMIGFISGIISGTIAYKS